MSRLEAVCAEDGTELARLCKKRKVDVATAERAARARTEQAIASTHDLACLKSLGARLRAEPNASVRDGVIWKSPTASRRSRRRSTASAVTRSGTDDAWAIWCGKRLMSS
jgi:hypothetical protein